MEPHMAQKEETRKSPPKRLMDKVAITGGARGIGAATAKLFAENGAHIIIANVVDDLGATLAESIGGRYIHCDVSKEADVELAINLALAWKGHLHIMLNNAGIEAIDGSITSLDMDHVRHLLSINLNRTIHGIKHAARAMVKGQKGGSIICTSSAAATVDGLASHAYTMSKEAKDGLVRSAACELGVHFIRVNSISPHRVVSEMLLSAFKRFEKVDITLEQLKGYIGKRASLLQGKGVTVEDVAQAALFLASNDASFITAQRFPVDGGYTSVVNHMSIIYQDLK